MVSPYREEQDDVHTGHVPKDADFRGTAQTQGRNIRHYANFLSERAKAFRDTKVDWVRNKDNRLERLTVDKGLLRETEAVQHQLTALLKCDVGASVHPNSGVR